MAKHSDLPIYKPGCDLLSLVVDVQTQLPRMYKRSLGEKIHQQCMDALECMAVANALRGPGRVEQLDLLLTKLRSAEALLRVCNEKKLISHARWSLRRTRVVDQMVDDAIVGAAARPGPIDANQVRVAANSYLGSVRQASHTHGDQAAICRAALKRGHVVDGDLTRVFAKVRE